MGKMRTKMSTMWSSASQSNVSSSSKDKSRKRTKSGNEDSGGRISIESNDYGLNDVDSANPLQEKEHKAARKARGSAKPPAKKQKTSMRNKEPESSSRKTKCQETNKVVEMTEEQKKVERQSRQDARRLLNNHREKISQKLRTFNAYDGFEVTNCSFVKSNVEICYILKDAMPIDKEKLKESLASHLGIQADDLKLTELRSRPVYKETSIQPGDRVCLNRQLHSQSAIGAFVKVPEKGIHALMCGHDKAPGDTFCHPNGNRLGRVEVSLITPSQNIPTNEDDFFRDISLGRLYDQSPLSSTVTTGDGITLRLEEDPEDADDEMPVRLFIDGDRQAKITSTFHSRIDERLNIRHRFLRVQNSEGYPVHDDGESGILIVSEPSGDHANGALASCSVTAVGMLVDHETKTHVDGRIEKVSLAAPLESGFDALRSDPYCNGEVKFC